MHTGTNHLKCVQCGQNAIKPLKVEDSTEVKLMFKCMVSSSLNPSVNSNKNNIHGRKSSG